MSPPFVCPVCGHECAWGYYLGLPCHMCGTGRPEDDDYDEIGGEG